MRYEWNTSRISWEHYRDMILFVWRYSWIYLKLVYHNFQDYYIYITILYHLYPSALNMDPFGTIFPFFSEIPTDPYGSAMLGWVNTYQCLLGGWTSLKLPWRVTVTSCITWISMDESANFLLSANSLVDWLLVAGSYPEVLPGDF